MGSKSVSEEGKEDWHVVDDLLRERAGEEQQRPLLAYPRTHNGLTDYDIFTGRQLDNFTNAAVQALLEREFSPAPLDSFPVAPVAGLLGHSTLDYIISMFALSRLGYTVLLLSPRMTLEAWQHLTKAAKCDIVLYGPAFK